MEHSGLSASDVLALTRNNGYDDNCMGGMGFWWVIVFLIVAGMFNGNGFGFGNNGATNTLIGEDEFIKRDIFNTNQNVSSSSCQTQRDVLENRYTTQLGFANSDAKAQACCCETQKEILQSRYDNALQNQAMQAQLSQCCCDLRAESLANTQKILDKLCENEINTLRTDLQSAQLQISQLSQTNNLVNTLRPTPIPAYITYSPYTSVYGNCGCGYGV